MAALQDTGKIASELIEQAKEVRLSICLSIPRGKAPEPMLTNGRIR
jgi:hypothetical protein